MVVVVVVVVGGNFFYLHAHFLRSTKSIMFSMIPSECHMDLPKYGHLFRVKFRSIDKI